jgi:hypothetical protein
MKPLLKKASLVALCGQAGSGKSTSAEILMNEYGYQRIKFAGPLKSMLRALGLTHDHLEGDLKEIPCDLLGGKTPRQAMQSLGTEWGRDTIHPDLWTRAWKHKAQAYLDGGIDVVVDDCRFPNELRAVRELGGVSVMIERPGTALVNHHISEQYVIETDFTIVNDGALGDLKRNLNNIIS